MLLKNLTDYFREQVIKFDYQFPTDLEFHVGPQHDFTEKIVKKVLLTQFLTLKSITYAKKMKCNLIISKFGIFNHLFPGIDEYLQKLLLLVIQSRIMVCALPPYWEYLPQGSISHLGRILYLEYDKLLLNSSSQPIGKIFIHKEGVQSSTLLSTLHRNLNLPVIYGNLSKIHKPLHSVIISNSDNITPNIIKTVKYEGCDCIISPKLSIGVLPILNFYEIGYIELFYHTLLESTLQRLSSTLATEFPRIEFEFFPSNPILRIYTRKENH